jgi:RNA polymerase sigma-70 factor (ECF subfamily)
VAVAEETDAAPAGEPAARVQDPAFAREAISHLDTLYRTALRLTRDPGRAEDLVQDTYVRALRYQHSYRRGTNMKAWLFAIMRNLFWDRFRGGRPDPLSLDGDSELSLYDTLADQTAQPEAEVLNQIAAEEVVAAVEELPELHREVVLLVDVEGFAYKDAAAVMGVPIGTVMSRLHRARRQLQKLLLGYAREAGIVKDGGKAS